MISRHDEALAAHRAHIAGHIASCRDDDCTFCPDLAEDAKWEREGIR